jgi:hypothetical protein
MTLRTDPDDLSQGPTKTVSDATFGAPAGRQLAITSTANLPVIAAGDYFEVRDHSNTVNNGLWKETGGSPTTSSITATKVSGSDPAAASSEAIVTLGNTTTKKTVMFDCAARDIYILEQGLVNSDGVTGQCLYSFSMMAWKDDAFLIANAPFPLTCIDADAGKYFVGQDPTGNYNGWCFADNGTYSIRTRKLLRNMGWSEMDANGVQQAVYAGVTTLGGFEDEAFDTADYQFGTDTTVNDTAAYTFPGPVNEAVKCYEQKGNPATCTFATSTTITRTGGSFVTEGYKVGGEVNVSLATIPGNNGNDTVTAIVALTLTCAGATWSTGADTAVQLAVDNRKSFTNRLRVRDSDTYGKSFDQANLASAGQTSLGNRVFAFPLANAADLKIEETDANIDGNAPYTGMSLTFYGAPQSKGGSGADELVGGPYNFGMVINCNSGTSKQVYEWLQRQPRKTTDIDAGSGTVIGKTMDGLARFLGDAFQAGSVNGGLTFPTNPIGGGSGLFLEGLTASSRNQTTMYDNLGQVRSYPVGTVVTLDANATLEGDAAAAYTLFYDRTIRNTIADLRVNAGSGATGTITSATSALPATLNRGAGAYVRVGGLTGVDVAMNGVYQVTSIAVGSYGVIRYDGTAIVTTTAASATLDQNCVDTPDATIVHDNTATDVSGTFSGTDFQFTYDYTGNTQGGAAGNADKYVVCKAIGQSGAQYTASTVSTIASGIALTIPLVSAIERNFNNPV